MLKRKKVDEIEYSIISKGTEREGSSKGYMAVTFCDSNKKRKILPIPHGIKKSHYNLHYLDVKEDVNIEKIAFSRFQLIPAIMYEKNRRYFDKKESILVIGSGSVGFTTCMELCRQGHKKISLLIRKNKQIKTNIFKEIYGISLNLISDFKKIKRFKYIIDATGNSDVLRKIVDLCNPFSTIFILGTPRKKPLINSLIIHRKNIHLIGCHEIIGLTNKERNYIFDNIIKENKKHPTFLYQQISNIKDYSKKNREIGLKTDENIIEILRYNQDG